MKQFSARAGKIKSSAGKRASRCSSDEWQKYEINGWFRGRS